LTQILFSGHFVAQFAGKIDAMFWLLIALTFLVAVLLWLPLEVLIDTQQEVYAAQWRGVARFRAAPGLPQWRWFLRIFFWEFEMRRGKKAAPRARAVEVRKPRRRRPRLSWRLVRALLRHGLRAVRIRRFRVDWDTGDFALNAWLYPLFRRVSAGPRQLAVNFNGQQDLAIHLRTRLGLLAWAGLQVFLSSK
jgi:hypothetical protein